MNDDSHETKGLTRRDFIRVGATVQWAWRCPAWRVDRFRRRDHGPAARRRYGGPDWRSARWWGVRLESRVIPLAVKSG